MSQVDNKNGCLGYKPGSHKSGLLAHQPTNTLGFSQVIKHSCTFQKPDSANSIYIMLPKEHVNCSTVKHSYIFSFTVYYPNWK